jgi:hypothetical protein
MSQYLIPTNAERGDSKEARARVEHCTSLEDGSSAVALANTIPVVVDDAIVYDASIKDSPSSAPQWVACSKAIMKLNRDTLLLHSVHPKSTFLNILSLLLLVVVVDSVGKLDADIVEGWWRKRLG